MFSKKEKNPLKRVKYLRHFSRDGEVNCHGQDVIQSLELSIVIQNLKLSYATKTKPSGILHVLIKIYFVPTLIWVHLN